MSEGEMEKGPDREDVVSKHFETATNPKINSQVRDASAEALHHLSKDVGRNRYLEMLRKLMFDK